MLFLKFTFHPKEPAFYLDKHSLRLTNMYTVKKTISNKLQIEH